ncbi:MAG: hypothetical protein [Bacteriophage sp.]|nr:MAG: hypothetical protein [Bacteriophage sp.]
MDIATLGIEVRSESLLRASQDLDKFAGATQRVEQRMQGFSTGTTAMNGALNRLSNSVQNAGRVMNGFNNALQLLGLGIAANEIKQYADSWTRMGNKITTASQASGVQARSLESIRQSADNARIGMEAYIDLYARIMRSSKGVIKSEQEVTDVTDTVSKAFAIAGATAAEQAAGVLQLSQALGSGVLQGDELRSLRENSPVLMQAIAEEFGTTISGLKQLGAEGKLTTDRLVKAILSAKSQIDDQFNSTSSTIEQSLTIVKNAATQFIGVTDKMTGSSKIITQSLKGIAEHFELIGNSVLAIGGIAFAKIFGPMIANVGTAVASQIKLSTAVLEGNAVMLNSRTAILQKANAAKAAAIADQMAAKAALELARAEAVKAKARLDANAASQGTIFLSTPQGKASTQEISKKHSQVMADLAEKEKAYANATVIAANKTDLANKALKGASTTARVFGGAMSLASKAMNFAGGPVGVAIMTVGTAMYFSAKRAEEAHEQSQKLQKVWEQMGYTAPITANNIDKITESVVRLSKGERFRFVNDSNKEIDRLLQTKKQRKATEDLPLVGTPLQGDELISLIGQSKKVKINTQEDSNALKILREQAEIVQKLPSQATEAKRVMESLLQTNVNSDVANILRSTIKSLDTIQAGLNGLSFNGFNRGLEQADAEFQSTLKQWGTMLSEDTKAKLEDLGQEMKTTGMTTEEFSKKVREIVPDQGMSGLLQQLDLVAQGFSSAKKQAENLSNVIDKISNRTVEVGINLTGFGMGIQAAKDFDEGMKVVGQNYEKLAENAKKTPAQLRQDSIAQQLTAGTKISPDDPKVRNMAAIIDKNAQNAKNSEKTFRQEANAYRDLIKSGEDRVAQLELEAQVAGKAGVAADTLRMKLELEQKATDKGRVITAQKRQEIDKLVDSYQKAADASAKAKLNQDLSYQWRQMGRTDIDKSVADTLKQYGLEENLNSIDAANIRLLETTQRNQQAWQKFGDTAEDALYRVISKTDNWRDTLASLMPSLKDLVLQISGLSDNKNSLGGMLGNLFAGGSGGSSTLMSKYGGMTGLFAKGGAFGTTTRMFAKGGTFTNSIVNSPTPFKFADGDAFSAGVMGEAGPEAVMPLKRDAKGALGVAVNGFSRPQQTTQQEQKTVVVHVEPSEYFNVRVQEIASEVSKSNIKNYDNSLNYTIGTKIDNARKNNRAGTW